MEIISKGNKNIAVDILATAFKDNAGALWVIKKDNKIQARLKVLCNFCVDVAIEKNGAYITADQKGVALMFRSNARQRLLNWLNGYLSLGNYCIGWDRAWGMIQRERKILGFRPKDEHLYFWMVGVKDNRHGVDTIIEIRDFTFRRSRELMLPIVAETTSKKNLAVYQRYGFNVYNEWHVQNQGITIWFLIRDWAR